MRNTSKWLMAAVVSLAAWSSAMAEVKKPAMLETGAASLIAKVESIDYKARTVTLEDPFGKKTTMNVGPEAIRFDQIKKGDTVKVDYLESVAVVVQSPDKSVSSVEGSQSVIVRNAGKKPSGTAVQTDVITATVERIDAKKRTATLKSPDGNSFNINVAPDVEHLENVKKGDQLMVKVTRTLAIDISKPEK